MGGFGNTDKGSLVNGSFIAKEFDKILHHGGSI